MTHLIGQIVPAPGKGRNIRTFGERMKRPILLQTNWGGSSPGSAPNWSKAVELGCPDTLSVAKW
jgi:hypothetical protein